MRIALIVAVDEGGVIGRKNQVPWRLATDLQRFKRLTMGHHIIMGRKTWESIGRALPGRTSIIVTRQANYAAGDARVAPSLDAALEMAEKRGETEAFIIGGAEIYTLALPGADRIYLTRVHTVTPDGDTYFPQVDSGEWSILEETRFEADDKNPASSTYLVLERSTAENPAG
jgi:dihydrofolate reductase